MDNEIGFTLKPVTDAAASGGGYRAVLTTAKVDAMDGDDVIAEALDRGYIVEMNETTWRSPYIKAICKLLRPCAEHA